MCICVCKKNKATVISSILATQKDLTTLTAYRLQVGRCAVGACMDAWMGERVSECGGARVRCG